MVTGARWASISNSPKRFFASLADIVRMRDLQTAGAKVATLVLASVKAASAARPGRLLGRRHDPGGHRLDLGLGQRPVGGLQADRDRQRLLALADARALVDVEQPDLADQAAVDDPCIASSSLPAGTVSVDHEGEVAVDRRVRQRLQRRPRLARTRLRHAARRRGRARRRPPVPRGRTPCQHARVQLAEDGQHGRPCRRLPERPGWYQAGRLGHDLDAVRLDAQRPPAPPARRPWRRARRPARARCAQCRGAARAVAHAGQRHHLLAGHGAGEARAQLEQRAMRPACGRGCARPPRRGWAAARAASPTARR